MEIKPGLIYKAKYDGEIVKVVVISPHRLTIYSFREKAYRECSCGFFQDAFIPLKVYNSPLWKALNG